MYISKKVSIFRTFSQNLFKNVILIVFRETEHQGNESVVISTKRVDKQRLQITS